MSSEIVDYNSYLPQHIGVFVILTFIAYFLLSVAFYTLLVRYLTGNGGTDSGPVIVSVVSLTLASLPSGLMPIDALLVGYMKNSSGLFEPWASDLRVRQDVSSVLLCSYYACYIAVLVCVFFAIPIAFFFHKKDENASSSRDAKGITYTLCHSAVCVLVLAVLLTVGYFVPTRELPKDNSTFHNLLEDLQTNHLEDTLAFALNIIRVVGMAVISLYVGIGLAAAPIGHLRGYRDPRQELGDVVNRRLGVELEIAGIRQSRSSLADEESLPRSEQIRQLELEHEDLELREKEAQLRDATSHWLTRLVSFSRPVQIVVGVVGVSIGLLVFGSLLMTNVLRILSSLGEKFGYIMTSVNPLDPLDRFLLIIQGLFPLDYAALTFLIWLLVLGFVSGCHRIGVGIPWIKVYDVLPWKTENHPLLIVTVKMALMLLAVDVFVLSFVPQYATYSSQHYVTCSYPPLPTPLPDNGTSALVDVGCTEEVKTCGWGPDVREGECVMTRLAVLWTRTSYKTWYLSALVHWFSWIFLVVLVLEACFAICRQPTTSRSIDSNSI